MRLRRRRRRPACRADSTAATRARRFCCRKRSGYERRGYPCPRPRWRFPRLRGRPCETAGPSGGVLDKLARHIFVVADIPPVGAVAASGVERSVGSFGPGDTDAAGFFADLDRGAVGDPSLLIGKEN